MYSNTLFVSVCVLLNCLDIMSDDNFGLFLLEYINTGIFEVISQIHTACYNFTLPELQ